MSRYRLEITLDEELKGRLDAARGFEPRASFVKRALERVLATDVGELEDARVSSPDVPASTRASDDKHRAAMTGEAVSKGLQKAAAPPRLASDDDALPPTPLPKIAARRP